MKSFVAWGLTLLGLAVISTVSEMLLPQGKTRNVIRSVMATVATLAMVTPLPQIFNNGFDFDFSDGYVTLDKSYIEYVEKSNARVAEDGANEYLRQQGYSGIKVFVVLDGYKVKSVTAKVDDFGITQNGEHINKSEITALIAEYFGIDREAIMVYG